MEPPKPTKDLKIRNVSLHSRGKKETGTLYLTRHHLIFSYVPDSGSRTSTSSKVEQLRNSASLDGSRARESSDSTSRQVTPSKARPKEIWVPYPMINHCVLRPSHSSGSRAYESAATESSDGAFDDGAFPPVYGTSSYSARPSTDSTHLAPYSSPQRPSSPAASVTGLPLANENVRAPAIRIQRRDFQMMAFHFHPSQSDKSPPDDTAREVFYCLRSRCVVDNVQDMLAFHFKAPPEELAVEEPRYDARREFARMGIGGKAAEGPGSAWRISDINKNYEYSPTYPSVLCVPRAVSDNMLKYGGAFRSKARIPSLTYLHSNGGSITRSSQPMVGLSNKRNPQDERLISAIFSSHTPLQQSPTDSPAQIAVDGAGDVPGLPTSQSETALDDDFNEEETIPQKRIYGSTRRNMIFDARPKINALVNKGSGGGYEDLSNYSGPPGTTVERTFMDIQNIHVMKKSLAKVVQSFANSDYLDLKPNEELLRNSGWLTHIAGVLDGSEMVARIVGLGGSHALVHCSDGWDRTAQVAALAQVMLDAHYRTLNGFITLIQKDFLAYGHKFNHRHGIQGSEDWFEIENERVLPSKSKTNGNNEATGLNALGSKALSGAKNWFEKSRGGLFRPQNDSKDSGEDDDSRPSSPPPNSIMHSPPTSSTKKDREHKTNTNEMGPIFHQFLDAVYQLQYQFPNAFEFNERFLRRLFYQAHSGQYGEFLFNNEKDRSEHEGKLPSVWPHFLSRRQEFINPEYVPKTDDPLLFPKRSGMNREVEVRWWSGIFGRKDEEMNTARALAPPDPQPAEQQKVPSLSMQPSTMSLEDGTKEQIEGENTGGSAIKEAKSFPNLGAVQSSLSSIGSPAGKGQETVENGKPSATRPIFESRETNPDVLQNYIKEAETTQESSMAGSSSKPPVAQMDMDEGDPLGVGSGSKVPETGGGRLDYAAFAKSSAYSDR